MGEAHRPWVATILGAEDPIAELAVGAVLVAGPEKKLGKNACRCICTAVGAALAAKLLGLVYMVTPVCRGG